MTIIRVCLDDTDRKQYGGDDGPLPAELVLDTEALKDMGAGDLDAVEREMDLAVAGLLTVIEPRLSGLSFARRAVAYLAVRMAGHAVSFAEFQPKLLRATFTQEDAGRPPAGPSEVSSEA
ncbi:hypothetical protein ACGF5C_31535 [Micromonospora sp. NPDC047620]|uniref:hypothetical protein n=1 Tax=Micromonospora sp. NPDC047620 TaxID=3364251 RepID=UPI003711F6F9